MSFTNLMVAIIAMAIGAWAYRRFSIKRERLAKIDRVLASPPRWYENHNDGVTAIYRADDFVRELAEFERQVAAGERSADEEIRFVVKPAFTFWSIESKKRLAHTGGPKELADLTRELVEQVTGLTMKQINDATFNRTSWGSNDIAKHIVHESPFPRVPLSGTVFNSRKQSDFLHYTIEEARGYLLYGYALPIATVETSVVEGPQAVEL